MDAQMDASNKAPFIVIPGYQVGEKKKNGVSVSVIKKITSKKEKKEIEKLIPEGFKGRVCFW